MTSTSHLAGDMPGTSHSAHPERKYQIDPKYSPDSAWEKDELFNSIEDIYNATRHGLGKMFFGLHFYHLQYVHN